MGREGLSHQEATERTATIVREELQVANMPDGLVTALVGMLTGDTTNAGQLVGQLAGALTKLKT